jgi:hypothetical protein
MLRTVHQLRFRRRNQIIRGRQARGLHVGAVRLPVTRPELGAMKSCAHGAMDELFIRPSDLHLHRNMILESVFRQQATAE